MPADKKVNIYATCSSKREEPDYTISEEVAKKLGKNFRVIPTYGNGQFEYALKRHYSMNRNELLHCRWLEYKKHFEQRVFAPFQFPDVRDLHFHNCVIKFLPSESTHRLPDYKRKLKVGPGVDGVGQMPIPQELLMKRIVKL